MFIKKQKTEDARRYWELSNWEILQNWWRESMFGNRQSSKQQQWAHKRWIAAAAQRSILSPRSVSRVRATVQILAGTHTVIEVSFQKNNAHKQKWIMMREKSDRRHYLTVKLSGYFIRFAVSSSKHLGLLVILFWYDIIRK